MLSSNFNKLLPFWLFTFAVICALVLSQLVQEGAFMDGMLYVAVSKNFALDNGTFWNPNLSQTFLTNFREQPPLYFGLLGTLYKVLGLSIYVERLFCFLCLVLNTFYIHKLWKAIYKNDTEMAKQSWLPILLWITIPVSFWAYTNHVEETLMSVFTLASVYYLYQALHKKQDLFFNISLAGIFIVLASLTKGIQGLFPLATVGCYWLASKKIPFSKMLKYSLFLLVVPTIIYELLLLNTEVYESFKKYFEIRLIGTFNNVGATTESHFNLLWVLFQELLPLLILTTLILFFNRRKKHIQLSKENKQTMTFLLLIGLSGTLPLMVTLEQRGFYIVTALPFFAIAFAIIIAPYVTLFTEFIYRNSKVFKIITISCALLLVSSVLYSAMQVGKYKRYEALITDIKLIGTKVPKNTIIDMPTDMANDWSTICYFIRYNDISLSFQDTTHSYYVIRKDLPKEFVPKTFKLTTLATSELDLYQR